MGRTNERNEDEEREPTPKDEREEKPKRDKVGRHIASVSLLRSCLPPASVSSRANRERRISWLMHAQTIFFFYLSFIIHDVYIYVTQSYMFFLDLFDL